MLSGIEHSYHILQTCFRENNHVSILYSLITKTLMLKTLISIANQYKKIIPILIFPLK